MRALKTPKTPPRKVLLGISLSVVVAAAIALLLRAGLAGPSYTIDPASVALTSDDVGSQFSVVSTGPVPPAQHTIEPLPYQREYVGGQVRTFVSASVLSPEGTREINEWSQRYGGPVTSPPTVMGPFVADHKGVFEIFDVERSFKTADAARQEYHCCQYVGRDQSFSDSQTLAIRLGDEADGWTGINKPLTGPTISPSMPTDAAYQERGYSLHWRRGPIVSTLAVWGSHDITLGDALALGRIIDRRITQTVS